MVSQSFGFIVTWTYAANSERVTLTGHLDTGGVDPWQFSDYDDALAIVEDIYRWVGALA
jgi:hypothetical protein